MIQLSKIEGVYMKNNKKKLFLFLIIFILFLILVELCIYFLKFKPYVVFESRIESINDYEVADSKILGWIQVQGTDIDYPVIRETIEAYESGIDYLWQPDTFEEGNNRRAIYGHNILNVSSSPLIRDPKHTRFEQLLGFSYYDYAKDNLYIQYTHDGKDEIYKIYAISFLYGTEDEGQSSNDKEIIDSYIETTKSRSLYNYNVEVNSDDVLISLITCTRYFGITGKTQFKIDARKVRKNEKIVKYSVETTKNYDIIK